MTARGIVSPTPPSARYYALKTHSAWAEIFFIVWFIELIDSIVAVAESTSDELSQNDGYEIKLEEDIQLQLPFLLPEEGYSSDIIRGVPPGLQEFLEPLCSTGRLICFPLDYFVSNKVKRWISKKGESQNGCYKKTKHTKFS